MRVIDKNITKYASIQAFAVVMIAVSVLCGWLFSIAFFNHPIAQWISMNPATAVAFIFSGSSFLLFNTKIHSKTKHLLASTLAGCVCLIGILKMIELLTGIELGLDSILRSMGSAEINETIVNSMSGTTALCFVLVGFSLFLVNMDVFPKPILAHLLVFIVALVSVFSLIYALLAPEIITAVFAPLGVHTSLCFLFISVPVLFIEHHKGLLKQFSNYLRTGKVMKSEKIYKAIASNIPNSAIFILDQDERFQLIEGDSIERLGYSRVNMLHKKAEAVIPPQLYQELGPLYKRVLKGERFSMQRCVNGFELLIHYVPLLSEDSGENMAMIISTDISDIKTAEMELLELNRKLERKVEQGTEQVRTSNKELEAFSYSVSHDLRAPLRAIDGYARMLEEDYSKLLDDEGRRLLFTVQSNAKRMGILIDNLLAFSRLSKKELVKTDVNMTGNASAALTEINKTLVHRAAIIIDDLEPAVADYSLMSQVFINLISNALKFSSKKDKPVVRIRSERLNNEIVYSVNDNGAGFEMQYVNKLFNVFQRLHSLEDYEGTGIGLAIVQRIVKKHGGRVWAEGRTGEGATFYFTLPVG
jgi:PAS domain S-box-containing protein